MDSTKCKEIAEYAADIFQRTVWLAYSEGQAGNLTRPQWAALRFFGRATRYSRTLTAFADYRATSLGSASQTLQVLVTRGLLLRSTSDNDRRSVRFDLTEEGWALLEAAPATELVRAISALPSAEMVRLRELLETLHSSIVEVRERSSLGICRACGSFKESFDQQQASPGRFCSRAKGELSNTDFEKLCTKYQQHAPAVGARQTVAPCNPVSPCGGTAGSPRRSSSHRFRSTRPKGPAPNSPS